MGSQNILVGFLVVVGILAITYVTLNAIGWTIANISIALDKKKQRNNDIDWLVKDYKKFKDDTILAVKTVKAKNVEDSDWEYTIARLLFDIYKIDPPRVKKYWIEGDYFQIKYWNGKEIITLTHRIHRRDK